MNGTTLKGVPQLIVLNHVYQQVTFKQRRE